MKTYSRFVLLVLLLVEMLPVYSEMTDMRPRASKEPIRPIQINNKLNLKKVALGRLLFFDKRLSRGQVFSCASCHDINRHGADGRMHPKGRDGNHRTINTLTIFNSALNHQLFWDGRASSIEQQIDFVVSDQSEFDTSWANLIATLKRIEIYQKKYRNIYNETITAENTRDALANFVRSLVTLNSRFDQFLSGNLSAINSQEKQGYQLFKNYGCISCHQGRNVGGNLFQKLGAFKRFYISRPNTDKFDLGRYNVTGTKSDKYVFRVPSLRLAVLTSPYFHDGSTATLKEAIQLMAKYQIGRDISDKDIKLIIKFLRTLPGEYNGRPLMQSTTFKRIVN